MSRRESNIELLRIIAFAFVVLLHSNGLANGLPTADECNNDVAFSMLRFFVQSLCISAVDIFVLISGWFGIKPSVKGLCKLIFQCAFFYFAIALVCYTTGAVKLSLKGLALDFISAIFVCWRSNLWFIPSYILLYLLSPVLNSFIENSSKVTVRNVVVVFFVYQTLYGLTDFANGFCSGYSTISFIGLYLMARYLKMFVFNQHNENRLSKRKCGFYFMFSISIVLFETAMTYFVYKYNLDLGKYDLKIKGMTLSYISPLVIAQAASLLIAFSKLNISSKTINIFASSSLCVYIMHQNDYAWNLFYKPLFNELFKMGNPIYYLIVLGIIILMFVVATMVDQIRKFLWQFFDRWLNIIVKQNT